MATDQTTPFDQISADDAGQDVSSGGEVEAAVAIKVEASTSPGQSGATAPEAPVPPSRGGWTIPVLCAGICILACAMILPQVEHNRRIVYQREKLKSDLARIDRQLEVNDEFLRRLSSDPNLAERLAQRQMKMVREGTNVLELKDTGQRDQMSPFTLVTLPPAPPMPEHQPLGGVLGQIFLQSRAKLYAMGVGFFLIAAGLVMGFVPRPASQA